MSLESDGYLSPDVGKWIAKHRSEHMAWFELANRLNRVCQRAMLGAVVPDADNRALLVILFFARALSSYQGAVLMVERGMSVEALTLARSCLESSFYLGAVANNLLRINQRDTVAQDRYETALGGFDALASLRLC
jgi:hypothetical protein